MGNIWYTRNGIMIKPYIPGQCRKIETLTSTYDKIYHRWTPVSGFYNEDLGVFATYKMGQHFIKDMFPDYQIRKIDPVIPVNTNEFTTSITLNKYQEDILAQMETYGDNHSVFINLPTAVGKTVLATVIIERRRVKTFIMCFSTKILNQWIDTFNDLTNIDMERVKLINSSSSFDKLLTIDSDVYDIYLCTTSLFDSYGKSHGYDRIFKIFNNLGIGLNIVDEAHLRLGTTVRLNAYTSVDYTVYLSADYNQANANKLKTFQNIFYGVPILKLSSEEMYELKHIDCYVKSFESSPSFEERNDICGNVYKWSDINYMRYEFNKEFLWNGIDEILNRILNEDVRNPEGKRYKILILSLLREDVDRLYEKYSERNLPRSIGRYYSDMDIEEKQEALTKDIIISTYKSFSTGVNVVNPEIRDVISTSVIDIVTANQTAGRCRPIKDLRSRFWILTDYAFVHCQNNVKKTGEYLLKNKVGKVEKI